MSKMVSMKLPAGKIKSLKMLDDGSYEVLIEVAEETIPAAVKEEDDFLVCIKASELSLTDEFMQHNPNGKREQKLKDALEAVIKKGIPDFWRPRMDPTLDKSENICFKAGEKPAVGKSYNWWRDNAKKFNPRRKSRLGTSTLPSLVC